MLHACIHCMYPIAILSYSQYVTYFKPCSERRIGYHTRKNCKKQNTVTIIIIECTYARAYTAYIATYSCALLDCRGLNRKEQLYIYGYGKLYITRE